MASRHNVFRGERPQYFCFIRMRGFAEQLSEEVGLSLEVRVVEEGKPGGFGGVDAGGLAVAAGLTVEDVVA